MEQNREDSKMARKKPRQKKSRITYCFVVEGCTEKNYIECLKSLYTHQVGKLENCKGGSAKSVLDKAAKMVKKNGDAFLGYVVWFDNDTYNQKADNNLKQQLESKNTSEMTIDIYMSEPCIESWLLAHFVKPQLGKKCDFYVKQLRQPKRIPNYEKKKDCKLLKDHINHKNIQVAITNYPEIGCLVQRYFAIN